MNSDEAATLRLVNAQPALGGKELERVVIDTICAVAHSNRSFTVNVVVAALDQRGIHKLDRRRILKQLHVSQEVLAVCREAGDIANGGNVDKTRVWESLVCKDANAPMVPWVLRERPPRLCTDCGEPALPDTGILRKCQRCFEIHERARAAAQTQRRREMKAALASTPPTAATPVAEEKPKKRVAKKSAEKKTKEPAVSEDSALLVRLLQEPLLPSANVRDFNDALCRIVTAQLHFYYNRVQGAVATQLAAELLYVVPDGIREIITNLRAQMTTLHKRVARARRLYSTPEEVAAYIKLGLPRNKKATVEEIKRAWKTKLKQVHPDHGGSEEETTEVNLAKAVLLPQRGL